MEEITKKFIQLKKAYLSNEVEMDAVSDKQLNWTFHLIFLNAVICCAMTWATANGHIPWEAAFFVIAFCVVALALAVNGLANTTYRQGKLKILNEGMEVLIYLLKALLAQTSVFMNLGLSRDCHASLSNLQKEVRCLIVSLDTMQRLNGRGQPERKEEKMYEQGYCYPCLDSG